MKKFYLLFIVVLASLMIVAQTPQAFKYQAIARDDAGNILSNWDISLRVSIIQGDQASEAVYTETHSLTSNLYGLINLMIGEGSAVKGEFKGVDWGKNSHFIKVEMDTKGGTDYKEVGASQLYAVPYALYAESAGSLVESGSSSGSGSGESGRKGVYKDRGTRTGTPNSKFPADDDSFLNVNIGNVGVGTDDPQEKLDVVGRITASEGFMTDGKNGLTTIYNIVTEIDFDNDLLKYLTVIYSGGLLTYRSDTSTWVDTVGAYISPPFDCGEYLIDTRDNKLYETVQIGTQCWMAENLNVGDYITSSVAQTDNGIIEKYCYGNIDYNCDTYGGMYNWDESMDWTEGEGNQGICPEGWHIPTLGEYQGMVAFLGGTGEGGQMKTTGTIQAGTGLWNDPNTGATNLSGFSAVPGGYYTDAFKKIGDRAHFWTSYHHDATNAREFNLEQSSSNVAETHSGRVVEKSVRCIAN